MNPGVLIGSTHPYPAYRPSNAEWLGDVPEHWEVRRLGEIGQVVTGSTPPRSKPDLFGGDIPWIRVADFSNSRPINKSREYISEAGLAYCRNVPQGTVLVSCIGTIGQVGIAGRSLVFNQQINGIIPTSQILSRFLYWSSRNQSEYLQALASATTIPILNGSSLAQLRLPLPPLPEQRAIVRYLDYADRRIRRYVGAKRRLVALLQEERQAVVSRAVTRGLDPNVRLKPSGVEWLGDVPEHWEVLTVKQHYAIQLGKMLQPNRQSQEDIEVPYLKALHVQWFSIRLNPQVTMWSTTREAQQFSVKQGDLLVCEGGEGGRAGLVQARLDGHIIQNALHRVRSKGSALNEYLLYVLFVVSSVGWLDAINNKATIAHFTREKLATLPIPLPPLPEQRAIVEHLERETARIDAAIERARRQAALVEEYRTRLVADVVTGKIDVREASASLPDEAEDDEDEPTAEDIEGDAFADDGEEESPEVALE